MNQAFLEWNEFFGIGPFDAVRDALHGDAEITEIVERDVKNNVAIVEVRRVFAAPAYRDRPSAFGGFDSLHADLLKNKEPEATPTRGCNFGLWILDRWPLTMVLYANDNYLSILTRNIRNS
jgi:hypothetical protein